MKERGYTIWIFREAIEPKKIHLPRPLTKILLAVVSVVVLLCPFVTYRCITQSIRLTSLERERATQGTRLASLDRNFSEIQQQMYRLRDFDAKLRIIANLESTPEGGSLLGVGGFSPPVGAPHSSPTDEVDVMGFEMARLSTEVTFRERSLRELYSSLEGKRRQLACTPSVRPVHGWLTSRFGYRRDPFTGLRQFHEGIDVSNTRIRQEYGLGLTLVLNHGHGIVTRYGHLSRVQVKVGQRMKRGQVIAAMGNTGRSTGPHLHYEVRLNGAPVNPEHYILN